MRDPEVHWPKQKARSLKSYTGSHKVIARSHKKYIFFFFQPLIFPPCPFCGSIVKIKQFIILVKKKKILWYSPSWRYSQVRKWSQKRRYWRFLPQNVNQVLPYSKPLTVHYFVNKNTFLLFLLLSFNYVYCKISRYYGNGQILPLITSALNMNLGFNQSESRIQQYCYVRSFTKPITLLFF